MDELKERARRAYELARLRRALPWALVPVPLVLLAGWEGAWAAGVLALLLVGLSSRGQEWGRGVGPGLAGGWGPFAFPVAAEWANGGCHVTGCATSCALACLVGGLVGAGSMVALLRRQSTERTVAALAVASLVASIGCFPMGLTGLTGVGVLWAATSPLLLLGRLRAT